MAAVLLVDLLAGTALKKTKFRFCLNTSTISGQKLGIVKYIEIAAAAGYDFADLCEEILASARVHGPARRREAMTPKPASVTRPREAVWLAPKAAVG